LLLIQGLDREPDGNLSIVRPRYHPPPDLSAPCPFEIWPAGLRWSGTQFGGSAFTAINLRLCLLRLSGTFQECRFARLRISRKDAAAALSVTSREIFGHVRTATGDEVASARMDPAQRQKRVAEVRRPLHAVRTTFGGGMARDFGVCARGRPVPAEFHGIAEFLNRAWAANVEVSWLLLRPVLGADPDAPLCGSLDVLMTRGIKLKANGAWVQIHFPQHRVRATHYAIGFGPSSGPSVWRLECSEDGAACTSAQNQMLVRGRFGRDSPEVSKFELATPTECSFVRIQPRPGDRKLELTGFEVLDRF
jgi:hypothetical protein